MINGWFILSIRLVSPAPRSTLATMAGQVSLGRTLIAALTLLYLNAWSATAAVLRNFQVAQPPIVPQDAKQCTIKILQ